MLSKEETLEKINISLPSYAAEKISYASDSKFQEKEEILNKILKMRRIASSSYYDPAFRNVDYFKIRSYIFLQQAKLMEDVVDNYDRVVTPEYSYFWNYECLEIPELRTYFTWRTKIRKGEYPKVPTGYILIYLSELINLVGVSSTEEAFNKIAELVNFYYDDIPEIFFQRIFEKLPKDFVINYGLSIEKLQKVKIKEDFTNHYGLSIYREENIKKESKEDTDNYYKSMLKVYKKDYTDILKYLAKNSNYKILNSKFYETKYGFLIEKIIPDVFNDLDTYFKEKDLDFATTVLGKKEKNSKYQLFQNLPYYETREKVNFLTVISEIEEYHLQDKECIARIYMTNPNTRIFLGIILKQIEARLREKTGYKRKIGVNLEDLEKLPIKRNALCKKIKEERFLEVINQAVDNFLIEKQKELKKEMIDRRKSEILIDASTFDSIRESTLRIQEKLITEEEKQEDLDIEEQSIEEAFENKIKIEEIPEQETIIEMGTLGFLKSLTNLEFDILNKIIHNTTRNELEQLAKKNTLLLEVLIENINLKALDYMGDNLIEDVIDRIDIYEDYIDEIKTEIEKMEV